LSIFVRIWHNAVCPVDVHGCLPGLIPWITLEDFCPSDLLYWTPSLQNLPTAQAFCQQRFIIYYTDRI